MTTRYYWWGVSQDPETHKPYLVFLSDKGEEDALERGRELLAGINFEVKKLKTRSLSAASSAIRGGRLESTHSLKEAGQRIGHTKSIIRDRNRKINKESQKHINPMW